MNRFLILIYLLLPVTTLAEPLVIVLSWDGMRHDFPDKGSYPGLQRVETEGVRAKRLTPVYPSATFPGHVTLATGAPPTVHGIVDNQFFDSERGIYAYSSEADWILAEPMWIAAERQGIRAATYFWVGSESDWRQQRATYRIAPFDGNRAESEKVAQIIEWIDLPPDERPGLIMSYWNGADTTAHVKGPGHPDVAEVIGEQDENLQTLLSAIDERHLWPETTLIIVSDHGMARVTQSVEIKTAIEDSGLAARVFGGNAVQRIFVDKAADIPALLSLLRKQEHISVFAQDEIPQGLRVPNRTGDVVVTTEPPYTLSRSDSFTSKAIDLVSSLMDWGSGAHGYDPANPDMGGIFLAMGRGVSQSNELGEVLQLQVAPTIAALLGIEPPAQSESAAIDLSRESP